MLTQYIVFRQIPEGLAPAAACIGYFDGFHIGHRALIRRALENAEQKELKSAVITFDPDPWVIFFPDKQFQHLTSISDKIRILEHMGVDVLYILHFDKELASQTPDQFHEILARMQIKTLVCGFDFRYGYKNTGDVETLASQPFFDVSVVDAVRDKNGKISSTRIEECIKKGMVLEAARLLGVFYSLTGRIVHGYHRGGSVLSFPTANLDVDPQYILPKIGVYGGMVALSEGIYPAMINIGYNPTFQNPKLSVEAHIIDFHKDIYDQEARFFFIEKIRGEMQFPSPEALAAQLHRDVQTAKNLFDAHRIFVKNTAELWDKNTFIG